MFERVHGQAASFLGGGIAEAVGNVAMGQFVHGQGKEQGRGLDDELQQEGIHINIHKQLIAPKISRGSIFLR